MPIYRGQYFTSLPATAITGLTANKVPIVNGAGVLTTENIGYSSSNLELPGDIKFSNNIDHTIYIDKADDTNKGPDLFIIAGEGGDATEGDAAGDGGVAIFKGGKGGACTATQENGSGGDAKMIGGDAGLDTEDFGNAEGGNAELAGASEGVGGRSVKLGMSSEPVLLGDNVSQGSTGFTSLGNVQALTTLSTPTINVSSKIYGPAFISIASNTVLACSAGNNFSVSGTTQVDGIDNASSTNLGDEITLHFEGNLTVRHGQTPVGGVGFFLDGNANINTATKNVLIVKLSLIQGATRWRQIAAPTKVTS